MRTAIVRLLRLVLLILVVGCAGTANQGHAAGRIKSVPVARSESGTTTRPAAAESPLLAGKLPNGFSYYVRGREGIVPPNRLLLRLVVKAGAVHEDEDQRGVAHFIEHMAFEGTAHFPKSDLTRFIRSLGMTVGSDFTGTTYSDFTTYSIAVPSDEPETLHRALAFLRDVADSIQFEPANIELERRVLLEEWRTSRSIDARLDEARFELQLTGSPYTGHSAGATPAELASTTRETLLRYYRDWYRPDLMALLAIGAPEPASLSAAVGRVFGDLRATARQRPAMVPHFPPNEELLVNVVNDPDVLVPAVDFYARTEHGPPATESEFRTELEERLILSMLQQRLGHARIAHASFLGSTTAVVQQTRDLRLLSFSGHLTEDSVEGGLRSLFVELASSSRYGFRSQELAQALQAESTALGRYGGPDTPETAEALAYQLQLSFRTGTPYRDKAQCDAKTRGLLSSITLHDVNQWAQAHGGPRGWSVFVAAPSGAAIPTQAELRDWARQALLDPPQLPAPRANRPIVVNVAKPGSVIAVTKDDALSTTVLQLSNGVSVVVLPMKLSRNAVVIRGFLRGGTAQLSDEDFVQARLAEVFVSAAGAGDYERREIDQALAESSSSVEVGISQSWGNISIDTTTTGLETALEVAYLRLTQPRWSPAAFDAWKATATSWRGRNDEPPEAVFWSTVDELTNEDEPRSTWLEEPDLARVDEQKACAIWKQQLSDFNGATFFVIGAVDGARLESLAEKYLGSLPSGDLLVAAKPQPLPYPVGKMERSVDAGHEPHSRVVLEFMAPDPFSVELENDLEIFQAVFYARALEVLRGELGGVYSPNVWAWARREPEAHHAFRISFECAPENVERLTKAVFDELDALGRTGIGVEYLEPLRRDLQRKRNARLYDTGWWLATLERIYLYGDTFSQISDTPAALQRVTSPNISATARRLFDPNNYVRVVSRPSSAVYPP